MSFSPMLATNFFYKTEKIVPSFEGRPFCMDIKLDGERMLCHREGSKVCGLSADSGILMSPFCTSAKHLPLFFCGPPPPSRALCCKPL